MHPMRPNKIMTEENCVIWDEDDTRADRYPKSKAIADTLVLQANSDAFKTASLRFGTIYGEGDDMNITYTLKQLNDGQQKVQVGTNTTMRTLMYVESWASAHVLAAKALLAGEGVDGSKVDGEAFLISDGEDFLMYDFLRKVWREAGDETRIEICMSYRFGS